MPLHTFAPRGAAASVFRATEPEVVLSGPAGTGKSRACLERLLHLALAYPGCRLLIARKVAASIASTAMKTWRRDVLPEFERAGEVDFYGGSAVEPPQFRFRNGSVVLLAGLDRSIKIMSSEYDVIYVQEATELQLDDWEALGTRLRNGVIPFQQLLGDCNPGAPQHWLLRRAQEGVVRMIPCRHEDNPVLIGPDGRPTPRGAAYLAQLDRLTGARHARLRRGLWVAAEGQVYEGFDPGVHLAAEPPDRSWRRVWGVDFGFTNPAVISSWAVDPDGRLHADWEVYRTGCTVDDLVRLVPADRVRPTRIVTDHDAQARARLETLLQQGTVAADKRVRLGIDLVQQRLRPAEDGRPRLFLTSRPPVGGRDASLVERGVPACTADEITAYVWAPPRTDGQPRDEPLKVSDHGMDALRYVVSDLDSGGTVRMRWA